MIRALLIALVVSFIANVFLGFAFRAKDAELTKLTDAHAELRAAYERATQDVTIITKRADNAEAAARVARASARTHETRALAILQSAPSNPADACASADAVITAYLMERQAHAH